MSSYVWTSASIDKESPLPLLIWSILLTTLTLPSFLCFNSIHHRHELYSEDMMDRAVEMIVVCAQMNEHFSFMYADLCKRITDNWSSGTADEEVSNTTLHYTTPYIHGLDIIAVISSWCILTRLPTHPRTLSFKSPHGTPFQTSNNNYFKYYLQYSPVLAWLLLLLLCMQEESLGKHFRVKLLERCKDEFSIDRMKKLEGGKIYRFSSSTSLLL